MMTGKKENQRLMQLDVSQLRTDGGTQPRVAINDATVAEYAEVLRGGAKFPPIVVFDDSAKFWLADGFHRYYAHKQAGMDKIEADVRQGTLRDAILYSVGANREHGLRRTNADKRKAVLTMLTNKTVATSSDGVAWSDREIAGLCGVDHRFVGRTRASLGTVPSEKSSARRAYTTRHGTKSTMNTSRIRSANQARRQPSAVPTNTPPVAPPPIIQHGRRMAKTALELPHDPRWAARAVVGAMGREFARALVQELTAYLDSPEPKLCPNCGDPNCGGDCERDESDQT